MPTTFSLVAPLVAAAALGIIVLLCRWVFSTGYRGARPARRDTVPAGDYGLLVPVTTVRTRDDAEMLRGLLLQAGIRAGVSETGGDLQVLVFTTDLGRARALVSAG